VLGIASPARLEEAARADGSDAFIDLHGPEYPDLALAPGIAPDRVQTTVAMAARYCWN